MLEGVPATIKCFSLEVISDFRSQHTGQNQSYGLTWLKRETRVSLSCVLTRSDSEKGKGSVSPPRTQSAPVCWFHLQKPSNSPSSFHHLTTIPHLHLCFSPVPASYFSQLSHHVTPNTCLLKKNPLWLLTAYGINVLIMINKDLHTFHLNLPFQP